MLFTLFLLAAATAAAHLSSRSRPTVTLDSGTFTGTTAGVTEKFLGIPFAQPAARYELPQAIDAYIGDYDASSFGPSCAHQALKAPMLEGLPAEVVTLVVNLGFDVIFPASEDCLTINVVKPAGATTNSSLPIVAWIYGGGYTAGGTSMYDGSTIVSRSIAIDEPIIYVSFNYRLSGYGWLASQEVKDAGVGNLGMHDQRLALRWIQKYIGAFGGDPAKVTLWGESAGAFSVGSHMLINGGDNEGLFRAGFMQSGSPLPVGDITNGQKLDYDDVVDKTGCAGSSDTLNCLKTVDGDALQAAIDDSPFLFNYQSLVFAWQPRADGVLFPDNLQHLVQQGRVTQIPIISGDCDDEGTLFSLAQLNVTTDEEVREYIKTVMMPTISDEDLDTLLEFYPADPAEGSPYDTGILNALTPQFKRIASLQGDATFQGPRRFFLEHLSGKQPIYSYANKRLKVAPILGAFHASDLLTIYAGTDMTDYLIRFTATLDPNGDTGIYWPEWTSGSRQMLSFNDGLRPLSIIQDTYRDEAMKFLNQVLLKNTM